MFEKAIRQKLRFETTVGLLSVEDLWDLPLTHASKPNLDQIAKNLHRKLKEEDVSFVNPSVSNTADALKFEIVKHIIDVRQSEQAEAKKRADNRARKQQLMQMIAQKENDKLASSSVEDLKALLAEIDD